MGLLFAHPALVAELHKVKDCFNVDAIAALAAEQALLDQEHFRQLVRDALEQRKVLTAACREFGWTWPDSEANFLLVDTGSPQRAQDICSGLKKAGILVRHWSNWPELASKLRISVGNQEEMAAFVTCTRKLLHTLDGASTACTGEAP